MMENISTSVIFLGSLVVSFIISKIIRSWRTKNSRHLPPSLPALPLIGSLHIVPALEGWSRYFLKKSEQLGSVIGLHVGSQYAIVLNNREVINEALVKRSSDFAGRPELRVNSIGLNVNFKGIIDNTFDARFRRQHQVVLSILKEFGYGREIMETRILTEVSSLVGRISEKRGSPFFPKPVVTNSVLGVILNIIVGHSMEQSVTENVVNLVNVFIEEFKDAVDVDLFPLMRVFPHHRQIIRKLFSTKKKLFEFIEECVASSSENSFIRQYIEKEGTEFDPEQLAYIIRDLLVAGTETSASTVLWSIYLLTNHPDVQTKMQQEIDAVVPRNELPRLENKPHLPYTEATMLEIMRFKTLVPIALFHETKCDTTVAKFDVPAKTLVVCNLYAVHNDPAVWGDPAEFRPERFLDEAGQVTRREDIIPFSLGRRSCLGELLARQEIFLFLCGIVQNFVIKPPEGQTSVECQEKFITTLSPTPFDVRFIARD